MVFRKPYAFLIKNFRKIHILIMILFLYIFYKTLTLRSFIKEFITYLSYNKDVESITKYTSPLFFIVAILMMIVLIMLLTLLKKKEKPWKLYLVPITSCLIEIVIFYYAYSYFSSYDGEIVRKTAKAINDLLFVSTLFQYATLIILIIRILGVDLSKFSFQNDKEFLEFDGDDKEEVEVSFKFDKGVFVRTYNKWKRNIGYFYEEHKFILNTAFVLFIIGVMGSLVYYFTVSHKTTKETNVLSANGYEIKINSSYYTDKDASGNIIEKNSSFVILNVIIKNNGGRRYLNTDNFHLINGTNDFTFTGSTYVNSFDDLGKKYTKRKFEIGEARSFAMIFKVDKKLDIDNFVLYYQEYKGMNNVYLRKLKLNMIDLSKIKTNSELNLDSELTVVYPTKKAKAFTLQNASFTDSSNYNIEKCNYDSCSIVQESVSAKAGEKILKMEFLSTDFEGKELIDFSSKYGKIIYIDNENYKRELKIEDALKNKNYLDNVLYIRVPNALESARTIQLIYIMRNQKYIYKIR